MTRDLGIGLLGKLGIGKLGNWGLGNHLTNPPITNPTIYPIRNLLSQKTKMKTYQPTLDDIVFEHRNRDYGAYELRKSYHSVLRKAVLLGVGFATIGLGSSFAYLKMHQEATVKVTDYVHTISELPPPEEVLPPAEKPTPPPPPPPIEKQLEVKAFLPPTPVDNALPETMLPPQEALTDVIIGTKDVVGEKSGGLPLIEDLPKPPTDEVTTAGVTEDNAPFTSVEMMPEFEGGNKKMYQWLSKNLNYPSAAVRANVQGKVFLNFIIERDGSITDVRVLKGIGFGCDEEAIRVVKEMPNWKAGRQNGRAVRVAYTIPIAFQLE